MNSQRLGSSVTFFSVADRPVLPFRYFWVRGHVHSGGARNRRMAAKVARTILLYIDRHPKVEFWVRNLVRKPNTFWLQTAQDRFFPDFVVRLKDGRILVVEYKGKTLTQLDSEKDKEIVGKTWAEASGGKCLFVMPVARDFAAIDRVIEAQSM